MSVEEFKKVTPIESLKAIIDAEGLDWDYEWVPDDEEKKERGLE